MRTNAPQLVTWIVAMVIGAIGVLTKFVSISFIPLSPFGFMLIAFLILAVATVKKGL